MNVPSWFWTKTDTFTHHLNIGYDVVGVEANLIVSLRLVVVEGDGSDAPPTTTTTTTTAAASGRLFVRVLVRVLFNIASPCAWLFVRILISVFLDITPFSCVRLLLWVFV